VGGEAAFLAGAAFLTEPPFLVGTLAACTDTVALRACVGFFFFFGIVFHELGGWRWCEGRL
jgi:hypothetical protein